MNLLQSIFNPKAFAEELTAKAADTSAVITKSSSVKADFVIPDAWRYSQIQAMLDGLIRPTVVGDNFIELYKTIPEVFWPIDFIAKRISEAHFDLKRTNDDSIVWCNRMGADRILKQPNPLMTWRELVYQHFVYKLATGNAFLRAAMADSVTPDANVFQWCSNFWELPAHRVYVRPKLHSYGTPIFGIADKDELLDGYTLDINEYSEKTIPSHQIWHDRDGLPTITSMSGFLKSDSRLLSVKKPIANLIAVYEARNVIYLKRGALGFIVAQKQDETGTIALEPREKEALQRAVDERYGVGAGKSPYAVTDVPVNFIRTNLSISELQPFDETLEDAIKIASVFGIPSVLVPRKDQATFSNQDTAEKSVYSSVIIPATKRFCEALTTFLGLERKGLYIDCDFSDVACLQTGLKEAEEVKKLVNDRCLSQFNSGLISINDWRAQIHEDAFKDEVFNKVKFDMTPEERARIDEVVNGKSASTSTSSPQAETEETEETEEDTETTETTETTEATEETTINQNINNQQPSKGEEENERTDD